MTTKEYQRNDLWELEEYEKRVKEYNNARLQRAGNKPHLPSTNQHGITSHGREIFERINAHLKKTNTQMRKPIEKIRPPLIVEAMETARKAVNLLVKKHDDYGPTNISDAPGGPLNGLSVRLHDKVARLNHLLSNNKQPKNEAIEDTFIDILNYAIIALLVIDGKWDTTK
jgi:S-adenosylmethionine hydrolase